MRKTDEMKSQETWNLVKTGLLKKTGGMLMPAQKMDAYETLIDRKKKERKQSIIWLQNVKCLHKSITTYDNMIELVQLFIR